MTDSINCLEARVSCLFVLQGNLIISMFLFAKKMRQLLNKLNTIDSNLDAQLETRNDNLHIPAGERCTSVLGTLVNIEKEIAEMRAKYLQLKTKRNDAYKRMHVEIQELKQKSSGLN